MPTIKQTLEPEATSGFAAGLTTCLILHPIDMVKTRLQVENSKLSLNNVFGRAFIMSKLIVKDYGFFGGLYRGLSPNLLGSSFSWTIYFVCYDYIKSHFPTSKIVNEKKELAGIAYFASSCIAGGVVLTLTNPIWVLKTRMCLSNRGDTKEYKGIVDGLKKIYKSEGIKGCYRGYFLGLMSTLHGGIQFIFYEKFKNLYNRNNRELANVDYLWMSSVSKTLALIATHPLQLLKTRMQNHASQENSSVYRVVSRTFKHEGLSGMYKGLGMNIARVLPGTCITFLVYENMMKWLKQDEVTQQ